MTHRARAHAIGEFTIKDNAGGEKLMELIEMEKYKSIRNKDGSSQPSRFWKVPLYRFWEIVNGRKEGDGKFVYGTYLDKFEFEGKTYSRNKFFYEEPIARADVKHKIKTELSKRGYRVFIQDVDEREDYKGEWHEKETYVKVQVQA